MAQADAECNEQSFTALESALLDEVSKLAQPVEELGDKLAKGHEDCDC